MRTRLARMRLSELAELLGTRLDEASQNDIEVRHATHNSRWVEPGDAYVALRGEQHDGHSFVADAVSRGAVAVIGEGLPDAVSCPVPYLRVEHGRLALAQAAAATQGNPAQHLFVAGVTGTDGKTTTSLMLRHLLRAAGLGTGLVSTVGYELPDGQLRQPPAHFTTPEAPQVQQILREIVDADGDAVVLESSSHALVLERIGGIQFDVALWTQLTIEHLDFHGSIDEYFAAKRRLIERTKFAVLNADDPWTQKLRGIAPEEWTYSASGADADWRASDIVDERTGLNFHVESPIGEFDVTVPMVGRFNVANSLAAMAAAVRAGATVEQLVAGLASFTGVPGRMELVTADGVEAAPRVIVDFAHTPPSIEQALLALRPTTRGKLWIVVGAPGGNRDPSKRAPMGEVTTRLADNVVFTEDDPRWTPLPEIFAESLAGIEGRTNFVTIDDRTEAIMHAIGSAAPDDTVLLAGKGPEETIARGREDQPWNETQTAKDALLARR